MTNRRGPSTIKLVKKGSREEAQDLLLVLRISLEGALKVFLVVVVAHSTAHLARGGSVEINSNQQTPRRCLSE